MQLPTSNQMQRLDHRTINTLGVPGCVLMENAGRGTVEYMEHHFGSVQGKSVIIFAGPGNNGGDGLVIARTVFNKGGRPHVYFPLSPEKLKGDAELNFQILVNFGIEFTVFQNSSDIEKAENDILALHRRFGVHTIVDSLFGTGLDRKISGRFKESVELVNRLQSRYRLPVTAADIPSGKHGDTGATMGCNVSADLTVTYGFPQPGHFHHGGEGIGLLEIVDIGIPSHLLKEIAPDGGYALNTKSLPRLHDRSLPSHKGTNGHLLILAGSTGKTGAAILAGRGALASGAGLVTLAVPSELNMIFEASLAEAMTVPLPNSPTFLQAGDFEQIIDISKDKNCIILGPGMGTDEQTAALVLNLYRKCPQPMVIDADGLNILAADKELLAHPGGPRVLTPHPGEMARLLDLSITEIQNDRAAAACRLRERCQGNMPVITVLKGAGTVISPLNGPWCVNTSGNPGMAAGGMGDVLAGIIGSLISQGYALWDAACLGVFLHGYGADLLAESQPFGYTASDVARKIPEAIGNIFQQQYILR